KTIIGNQAVKDNIITAQVIQLLASQGITAPTPEHVNAIKANISGNLENLVALPALNYGHLVVDQHSLWFTLEESGFVGSLADIMLEHGVEISGTWHFLGIMDALPDNFIGPTTSEFFNAPVNNINEFMRGLSHLARRLLGRPGNSFGMTPLVIF